MSEAPNPNESSQPPLSTAPAEQPPDLGLADPPENTPVATADAPLTAPLSPIDQILANDLESRVVEALRTVYDPEIPVNIYEMGLIYNIETTAEGGVNISMTLTSPACPVAGSLPIEVEQKVRGIAGVTNAQVEIVWEPPWTPEKMSEAAKLQLGFM